MIELKKVKKELQAMFGKSDDDIKNKLTAEIEKSERLELENKALKQQMAELQSNTVAMIAQAVNEAVAPLQKALDEANHEILRLKDIINKDSSNSNKPPSSNGFKHVPNLREKTGRKQGGQKGHPGHRLSLPDNLNELEAEGVIERRTIDHTDGASEYVKRYTLDLETRVIVTEHRFKVGEIPPERHNEVTYGDGIKVSSVVLLNEGIIAKKRLTEIFSGMTSGVINLSTGTLESFQTEFAEALEELKEIEAIETDLVNGEVIHSDDTQLRVLERPLQKDGELIIETTENGDQEILIEKAEGKTFQATVRTYANERSTRYTMNPSKHQKGIERDGILSIYDGIVSHDGESKFHNYGSENALCGAHLQRELKGIAELCNSWSKQEYPWAVDMKDLFSRMNHHKQADLEKGITSCDERILTTFELEFEKLLAEGKALTESMKGYEHGYKSAKNMVNRLEKRKDNYLLFIRNYTAPFTNNCAERSLRPEKIKQKVSGMFRSWGGILTHADIRSFIGTTKKRGENVFASVSKVFDGESVLSNQ